MKYSVNILLCYIVDNRKPQAGGRVTGPCWQSISGQKELLLSLPTGVLLPSLAVLLSFFRFPVFTLHPNQLNAWKMKDVFLANMLFSHLLLIIKIII